MSIQFTEKGKFFTDVVFKESIPATIQTLRCRIHGTAYLHRENRLIDELNSSEQFLAVTDAVVFNDNGEVIYRAEFLTVNRDHIVWLLPHEGDAKDQRPDPSTPGDHS